MLPPDRAGLARSPVLLGLDAFRRAPRCANRAALGWPCSDDAVAPRHVERELDLSHVREAAGDAEGLQHQLCASRGVVLRRVVAQLPPRAPGVSAPRGPAPPDRSLGRAHLVVRTSRLGNPCAMADPGPA